MLTKEFIISEDPKHNRITPKNSRLTPGDILSQKAQQITKFYLKTLHYHNLAVTNPIIPFDWFEITHLTQKL